jgi:hypothetical protein
VTPRQYSADMVYILRVLDQYAAVLTRVWRNGELVYSAFDGATPTTIAASDETSAWDDIDRGPT